MNSKLFDVSGNWIAGFFDAEGCFSIYYDQKNRTFKFEVFLTQKDFNVLEVCKEFLQSFAETINIFNQKIGDITESKGAFSLRIRIQPLLLQVIKPFFEKFPLFSSKWQDYLLFFAGLEIYLNNDMPKNVRNIYLTYIMYRMNTEGKQRRHTLEETLNDFKLLFNNDSDWLEACNNANEFVKQILEKNYPNQRISDDYLIGLICGDGCFHADFDMREKRKVTVRKALSISLIRTERNEQLLNQIADQMGFNWSKRQSSGKRHNPKVEKSGVILKILEPFFKKHFEKLTPIKKRHFLAWSAIDQLLNLVESHNQSDAQRIDDLIQEIYFVHQEGLYRKYSIDKVIERFKKDWVY